MVPGIRRFRQYYATIRFLLIVGGAVAFAIAALRSETTTGLMQNVGWFLLCATVLFIDPENPPDQKVVTTPDHDAILTADDLRAARAHWAGEPKEPE
jgi:hypothetical protein